MEQCEFCGAPLATGASFCGRCGHTLMSTSHHPTQIGATPEFPADENRLTSTSQQSGPQPGEFDVTSLSAGDARHTACSATSPSDLNARHLAHAPTDVVP